MSLLTDLYQLTMAYGYWKAGKADEEAVFHLFFRKLPFGGEYAVCAGLDYVIDYIRNFQFKAEEISYLATICGNDGKPLFDDEFLQYLAGLRFDGDIDAIDEGELVFPQQPIIRVKGALILGQLLETTLLNMVNFQTLVATKAARICQAAEGDAVVDFGLRRAQGVDGGLSASRAAYIGGCVATSNVMAGQLFGIPVKGTHAHSWVCSFEDEQQAFDTYAENLPNNTVLLVDTYNTVEGVKKAVRTAEKLRASGHEMIGIRLDSGDLTALSIEARRILDEAGFENAKIVASNDLDEYEVARLKKDGAKIDIWGVGTRLVTAYDQPALGGVYKLAAIRKPGEKWQYKAKFSSTPEKSTLPGIQQVRRTETIDVIYDIENGLPESLSEMDGAKLEITESLDGKDLLKPIFRQGKLVYRQPSLSEIREKAIANVNNRKDKRKVAVDEQIFELREQLYRSALNKKGKGNSKAKVII